MFIEVLTTEEILRWEIWFGKFGSLCYHDITANIFDWFLLHYDSKYYILRPSFNDLITIRNLQRMFIKMLFTEDNVSLGNLVLHVTKI